MPSNHCRVSPMLSAPLLGEYPGISRTGGVSFLIIPKKQESLKSSAPAAWVWK